MELNGEVVMAASRERVWSALNDNAVLQACIPGCESLVQDSDTSRRARVMVKVGPVRARFNGTLTLSEVQAPERCAMGFEGSGGAAGMATGSADVALHEHGSGTRVAWAVRAAVGGKLGQIGGRMIDAAARQIASQFFEALRARLEPGQPLPVPPAQEEPVLADSSGAGPRDLAPAPAMAAAPAPAAPIGDATRALWFLLGASSTAVGVWLGKTLF